MTDSSETLYGESHRVINEDNEESSKVNYSIELFKACLRGDNIKILECLDKGVNINEHCIYRYTSNWSSMEHPLGSTPLLLACSENKIKSVELLLEKGADINLSDNIDQTPLYIASSNGNIDLVKFLIEKI